MATTGCLMMGMVAFGNKNSRLSQLMMRGRVLAQGFTIFGLVGGVLVQLRKTNAGSTK